MYRYVVSVEANGSSIYHESGVVGSEHAARVAIERALIDRVGLHVANATNVEHNGTQCQIRTHIQQGW